MVKTQAANITLIGLRHLKIGLKGYYQNEADAFDDALAKTNTLLNSMRKRLDSIDAIEDKSKVLVEFKLLSRCAGELQNAWAEKHLRASRKVGQLLNEWRQNYGPEYYQILSTALRINEELTWREDPDTTEYDPNKDALTQVINCCASALVEVTK